MGDSGCRKCGEDGHFARDCPTGGGGGGGDDKCRNCRQEGHMASDCPEPEVCRRCRKEGHIKDDCPEPEKCFNCRQEGHSSSDCPEPELCRKCRKPGHVRDDCPEPDKCYNCREEGHQTADCPEPAKCRRCRKEGHEVADCPEPMRCGKCGEEGHMRKDCVNEERTYTFTNEEGETKEMYVPKADGDASELYSSGITSGINFAKYDDIPVSTTGDNVPSAIKSFTGAGLRPILVENVTKSGYKKPTPVQKNGIPIVMAGRDMMACAQTGSGKTAAFLLPIIHRMIEADADAGAGPQCIVVTPTRELAIQIHNEARKFAQGSMIKSVVAYGGTSVFYQASQLQRGCNILVATPGRLHDFVEKGRVSLSHCKYLVLDEADRMLDMGFMPEIQKMVENEDMPKKAPEGERQTLMFSATFPDEVQESAQEFLADDYLFLTIGLVGGACSDVKQDFYEVAKFDKRTKLEELMQDPERDPKERTLIFVQTKKNADFLATYLSGEGLPTTSIHGDRLQREREEALFDFRTGDKPILVATAVAARGLDIPNVAHVINYDMPDDVDEYVHRIGRTGRVGNLGKATSFVDTEGDGDVMPKLVDMLTKVGVEVPEFLGEGGAGGDAGGDDDEDWG